MAVVSIATLKTYFQTGDFPTEQEFINLIDTLDNASTSTYKKYVALLTQTGTNAPVATVLENTLGGTVVWTRSSDGVYHATLAGVFTASKTTSFATNGQNVAVIITSGRSTDNIVVLNSDGVDGSLSNCSIEIRVYP